MTIEIKSIGFTPRASLDETIEKKINKLKQIDSRIVSVVVQMKLGKETKDSNSLYHIDVRVYIPGKDFVVKKEDSSSFEKALDAAISTAKVTLRRYKEKHRAI